MKNELKQNQTRLRLSEYKKTKQAATLWWLPVIMMIINLQYSLIGYKKTTSEIVVFIIRIDLKLN